MTKAQIIKQYFSLLDARNVEEAIELAMQPCRVANDLYRFENQAHCFVGNV